MTKPLPEFRADAQEAMQLILYEIYSGNKTSPAISEETGIPEQTVRRHINKLVDSGYVMALTAIQRRKRAQLWLTKKGFKTISED